MARRRRTSSRHSIGSSNPHPDTLTFTLTLTRSPSPSPSLSPLLSPSPSPLTSHPSPLTLTSHLSPLTHHPHPSGSRPATRHPTGLWIDPMVPSRRDCWVLAQHQFRPAELEGRTWASGPGKLPSSVSPRTASANTLSQWPSHQRTLSAQRASRLPLAQRHCGFGGAPSTGRCARPAAHPVPWRAWVSVRVRVTAI